MLTLLQKALFLSQLIAVVTALPSCPEDSYPPNNFKATFSSSPQPMTIDVNPQFIAETGLKASLTRYPIDIDEEEFTEGLPNSNLTQFRNYWLEEYDWASRSDAIPLIFIHGWPGSFLELSKIIETLTTPPDDSPAFHVVAPSLPGFGFSPAPTTTGLGLVEVAAAFNELMQQLGYNHYVAQGGDFGGHTIRYMGAMFPDSVVSILSNNWGVAPNKTDLQRQARNETTDEENSYIAFYKQSDSTTQAFWAIEYTFPLQVGILLGDSPVGSLAWAYLGMRGLSPGYQWGVKDLITWAMMLYIPGSYGSIRMYRELKREGTLDLDFPSESVPAGVLQYYGDAGYGTPRDWCERTGNVTYFVRKPTSTLGGHFPSTINPTDLVGEMRKFWGSTAGGWRA